MDWDKDSMWDKIQRGLKDAASLSVEKIEEYTKLGKLKIEEMAAKRKIERNFIDIGQKAYDLLKENKKDNLATDAVILKAMDNVSGLRKELDDIVAKMKKIMEDAKAARSKKQDDDEEALGV